MVRLPCVWPGSPNPLSSSSCCTTGRGKPTISKTNARRRSIWWATCRWRRHPVWEEAAWMWLQCFMNLDET
jgi:hypothetical protein